MKIQCRIEQNRAKATVDNRQALKLTSRSEKITISGGIGRPWGDPSGARMGQRDIQKYSKKLMYFRDGSGTSFFTVLGAKWSQNDAKRRLKSYQKGSKMRPRSEIRRLLEHLNFGIVFGSVFGPLLNPVWIQNPSKADENAFKKTL